MIDNGYKGNINALFMTFVFNHILYTKIQTIELKVASQNNVLRTCTL
jgi:hypothetical protein